MTCLRITTPSRLHFGLLAYGGDAARQFGGVGLAIERPGIELTAEIASAWGADGPLAARALRVAERVTQRLSGRGESLPRLVFRIHRAPPEHVGLGTGTQLSLAITSAVIRLAGLPDASADVLAQLSGRGQRSGVGLHGFLRGGLIVDGGRRSGDRAPPLLARLELPDRWKVLIVLPAVDPGIHGSREIQAFAQLPPIPDHVTDRLCRLILLGMLPAVLEEDLEAFGMTLSELQAHVGECFAPVQGGIYARPELEAIITFLRAERLVGVGQSSWGPAIYGFSDAADNREAEILERTQRRFSLNGESAFWTRAACCGARLDLPKDEPAQT